MMRQIPSACMLVFALVVLAGQPARADDPSIAAYQRGCEGGDAFQCNALGMELERSSEEPGARTRAAAAFQKACDGGSFVACVNAGDLYISGIGLAKDADRAAKLYRRACDAHVVEVDACGRLTTLAAISAAPPPPTVVPKPAALAPARPASQSGAARKSQFYSLMMTADAALIGYLDRASIARSRSGTLTFNWEIITNGSWLRNEGYKVARYREMANCSRKTITILESTKLDDRLQVISHLTKPGQPNPVTPDTNDDVLYQAVCAGKWDDLYKLMQPDADGGSRVSIADAAYYSASENQKKGTP